MTSSAVNTLALIGLTEASPTPMKLTCTRYTPANDPGYPTFMQVSFSYKTRIGYTFPEELAKSTLSAFMSVPNPEPLIYTVAFRTGFKDIGIIEKIVHGATGAVQSKLSVFVELSPTLIVILWAPYVSQGGTIITASILLIEVMVAS